MQSNHIEEITFIMCECCCDFIIEEMTQERMGLPYCSDCQEVQS